MRRNGGVGQGRGVRGGERGWGNRSRRGRGMERVGWEEYREGEEGKK